MNTSASALGTILLISLFQTWKFSLTAEAEKVPPVFFFGDSYCDTGNDNNIPTFSRANFPPYGRDLLPPYLDPNLQDLDLLTDVSFASGAKPFWKQIEYFNESKARLTGMVGEERATVILMEAIHFIVIGTNDFVANYYAFPFRSSQLTISQYTDFLLQTYASYTQKLYSLNARKIGLINVPPLGCLPIERTLNYLERKGDCAEDINKAASGFDAGLNAKIEQLKSTLPGHKIVSLDYHGLILDFIHNPAKYRFEVTGKGCCGTGSIEFGILCNEFSPLTCRNAQIYLFFDAIHLAEKAYDIISTTFLSREILQLM